MKLHSYFIWGRVGYATNGAGVVDWLGRVVWVWSSKGSLAVSSFVFNVVYFAGAECDTSKT
jgi:hypothetical protein